MKIFDLVIIGGGPSGMMAAVAGPEAKTCLLEKNTSLGKKLLLTGKGRCNLTTVKSIEQIVSAFGSEGKFLYGALTRFSPQRLIEWFEARGVGLKVERGERVFPVSDSSETVLQALEQELKKRRVEIIFSFKVKKISFSNGLFRIENSLSKPVLGKKVIIATGGMSYPGTGSEGDGYKLAASLGHKIIVPKPSLVPLLTKDPDIPSLAGLALKNVKISFFANGRIIASGFGEMLFTHQGISGPIVLTASKTVVEELCKNEKVQASIDLKPALDKESLKKRLYKEIYMAPKKEYQTLLKTLLPASLIDFAIKKTKVDKHQQNSLLTKDQVLNLISFLKAWRFDIKAAAPIQVAIVTNGGVPVAEIDSRTMESKLVPGLFFAGEIISLPGPTGGFNLQKAFSTGWVAGNSN